jgi:hypothetical protein
VAARKPRFTQGADYVAAGYVISSEHGHTLASSKARFAELGAAGFNFKGAPDQRPFPVCHFHAIATIAGSAAHTAFGSSTECQPLGFSLPRLDASLRHDHCALLTQATWRRNTLLCAHSKRVLAHAVPSHPPRSPS